MLYIGLAILLGTVTMVVPLALFGPSDYTYMSEESIIIQPSPTDQATDNEKLDSQGRFYVDRGDLESNDTLAPAAPEPTAPDEASEPSSQEYVMTVKTAENPSDLSPIGLMTIPSFLIALGAFVYLRKRMS